MIEYNPKIQKTAEKFKLKITKYDGFVRGGWTGGWPGMWVFTVSPEDLNSTTDPEPMTIVAENIKDALKEIESCAKYYFN